MAINNELWALDASTGELVTRFVDQGTQDLRCGLARPMEEVGCLGLTTPSYRLYGSPHRRRFYFGRLWASYRAYLPGTDADVDVGISVG